MVVILQGTLRGILSSGDEGTSYITHHGFCNLKNISPYSIMEFLCISHSTVNFMSIDRRMDKEDVVNEILLSHRKDQNNAICNNMDGTRDYHTK